MWCRPVTWEQCFDGEGMLNKDAMVEKKAENDKLQELIQAKGWVKHESPIAERLGMPLAVWAAPTPTEAKGEAARFGVVAWSSTRPASRPRLLASQQEQR